VSGRSAAVDLPVSDDRAGAVPWWRAQGVLGPSRISGVYLLVAISAVFAVWLPATFPRADTAWQIVNSNAIPAMAALTLIIPLAAGVFDISVPYTMTLSGAVCTYAIVITGWPVWAAILLAVLVSLVVGVINAVIVVVWKIESLIGTLASGFVIQAMVLWRTDNLVIAGPELNGAFRDLAFHQPFAKLTLPVLYALAMAAVIGVVLRYTSTGRRLYATGFNSDAARLAGVRTARLQAGALVASSMLAGMTGVVLASNLGQGISNSGVVLLLPAFAGAFLGATQIRPGRFNPWGTVIAVLLLGTLTTGLSLGHAPQWIQQLVAGGVLVIALAVAGRDVRKIGHDRQLDEIVPEASEPVSEDVAGHEAPTTTGSKDISLGSARRKEEKI